MKRVQRNSTCFVGSCAMVRGARWGGTAATTTMQAPEKDGGKYRVGLSPEVHLRLKAHASKRLHGFGTISKLGRVILDGYLAHMERVYFGRARVLACTPVPKTARDIDAVIFDMDGVLCNSEDISRMVGAAVFDELYGVTVNEGDFAAFTGTGEENFLSGVAGLYKVPNFDAQVAKSHFMRLYVKGYYTLNLTAFPGVKGLIQRIKELGLKTAVASAADRDKVDENLRAIGLPRTTFDFVTSSENIVNKKPAPDVFLAAAQGLEVEPQRCVVVEDAVAGVQAARAAGMRCVGVATSLSADQLEEAGAHVVREQPAYIEVLDLFGRDVFAEVEADAEQQTAEQQTAE